jgi:DNA-binding NarL/FixJ family response regulator
MREAFIGAESRPERLYFVPRQDTKIELGVSGSPEPFEIVIPDNTLVEGQLTTEQELALGLFAQGLTTNQTARQLGLNKGTFRSKVWRPALQMLGVENKAEALTLYQNKNLTAGQGEA